MSFAALEARITTTALAKCANAVVVCGIETASATFDAPRQEVVGGMVHTTDPTLRLAVGALSGLDRDAALTVDGVAYVVREVSEPDAGLLTVTLRAD